MPVWLVLGLQSSANLTVPTTGEGDGPVELPADGVGAVPDPVGEGLAPPPQATTTSAMTSAMARKVAGPPEPMAGRGPMAAHLPMEGRDG
jgi:hypothetical protein